MVAEANNLYSNREIRISPDKRWLVATSDSADVRLYDMQNLDKAPVIFEEHEGHVRDIEFMPDGSGIITLGFDQRIYFYDFNRSRLLKRTENRVNRIKVAPDNRTIYAGTSDGKIIRISMADMSETVVVEASDMRQITSLELNPDGTKLAFGGLTGYVIMYDLLKNESIQELYGHTARISDVDFSNKGDLVVTSSWDGTMQMWNMNNLDDLPYYFTDNGQNYVWDVDFSPDDKYLVVGTRGGVLKKWAVSNADLSEQICQHLTRNMTEEEWDRYVSDEVDYRTTCESITNRDNS